MYHWSDNLCIGDPVIDRQHRELFKVAEKVEALIEDCGPHQTGTRDTARQQRVLQETIKYLKSYTLEHLATEEAFQREIGYKGYEEHKKIHDGFVETAKRMEQTIYDNDCSSECVSQLLDWVSAWLYNHIMHEDQKILEKEPEA